jgi:hypothetical protein
MIKKVLSSWLIFVYFDSTDSQNISNSTTRAPPEIVYRAQGTVLSIIGSAGSLSSNSVHIMQDDANHPHVGEFTTLLTSNGYGQIKSIREFIQLQNPVTKLESAFPFVIDLSKVVLALYSCYLKYKYRCRA